MAKILFIQGIHNYSLKERFVQDVSEATGMEVVYFPADYGIADTKRQLELIEKANGYIRESEERFILLAHSFGGILAYCLEDAVYEKVDRIITFASPHQVPFAWFKALIGKLPYKSEVPVQEQESCGFYFDLTVPFIFTRYRDTCRHKNFIGMHTHVPDRKKFFRSLILKEQQ